MIELVQFPWSPFCLVQSRILAYSGAPHRIVNTSPTDRSLIWRLTRQRYYQVPVLKDRRHVVFETEDNSQVIAKYLDSELNLDLFPRRWEGAQKIFWRYIENEVESLTFRLNDIYYKESVRPAEQMQYMRFKERKFGRGCIEHWRKTQREMVAQLGEYLLPFDQMVREQPFLLDGQPRFVDFDLWGMLANFLYSGHYKFPPRLARLRAWYQRMSQAKFADYTREKLHS